MLVTGPVTVRLLPTVTVEPEPPMLIAVPLPVAMLRVPVVKPVNTFITPVVTVELIESVPPAVPPATVRVFVLFGLPNVHVVAEAAFVATLIAVAAPNSLTVVATVLYKFCVVADPITVGALSVVIAPAPVDPIASVVAAVANDMFVDVDVNKLTVAALLCIDGLAIVVDPLAAIPNVIVAPPPPVPMLIVLVPVLEPVAILTDCAVVLVRPLAMVKVVAAPAKFKTVAPVLNSACVVLAPIIVPGLIVSEADALEPILITVAAPNALTVVAVVLARVNVVAVVLILPGTDNSPS